MISQVLIIDLTTIFKTPALHILCRVSMMCPYTQCDIISLTHELYCSIIKSDIHSLLTDKDLEMMIGIWSRKTRRIVAYTYSTLCIVQLLNVSKHLNWFTFKTKFLTGGKQKPRRVNAPPLNETL